MPRPTTTTTAHSWPAHQLAQPVLAQTHAQVLDVTDSDRGLRVAWRLGEIVDGAFVPHAAIRTCRAMIPAADLAAHVQQRSEGKAPAGDWRRADVLSWLDDTGWMDERGAGGE